MAIILIIEDDATMRMMTKEVLENYGFDVLVASDGAEGINAAHEYKPDLIISDIMMPEYNGFEVFEKLQEETTTQTIPFLFLSAISDLETLRKGMGLGADDYLVKPFRADDLYNAVTTRLNRQKQVEEKFSTTLNLLRRNITYALPHELRTPLMSVLGYGEIIYDEAATINRDELHEFAAEIVKAGNRLHRMIENYLVYAQLELIALDSKEIDALRRHLVIADKIIERYALEAVEKYQRLDDLRLNLAPNLGLQVSEENLGKMVAELVDNSCKFSESGTLLEVNAYREKQRVVIQVCDSGRGMSDEEIKNIGAYVQFDRALYEQQGLGLGLPIVIKLGTFHNASLQIESQKAMGTCVTLRFKTT